MSALAALIETALPQMRWSIESVSDAACAPADVSAIGGRVAQALRSQGALPDEPVIVRIGNRPSDIGSLLGTWQAGAVAVPLHVNAAPATVEALLNVSGARFSIDVDRLEFCGDAAPAPRALLRDAALVIFTSGSTGLPKGAVIGHQRLTDKLGVLDRLLRFKPGDTVLVPLQLTFIFGLWVVLLALQSGAKPVLVPRFSVDALKNGLDSGATILGGVPSMYRTLLANHGFTAPKLRMILTGGEVLPKPLALAMQTMSPAAGIFDLYGLTETGSCDFVVPPQDQPAALGTIGTPTQSVSYRIASPDGREMPEGESGELQIDHAVRHARLSRQPGADRGLRSTGRISAPATSHGFARTAASNWSAAPRTSSHAAASRSLRWRSTTCFASTPPLPRRSAPACPTSGLAKPSAPRWSAVPECRWTTMRCVHSCSNAPSGSRFPMHSTFATHYQRGQPARPIGVPSLSYSPGKLDSRYCTAWRSRIANGCGLAMGFEAAKRTGRGSGSGTSSLAIVSLPTLASSAGADTAAGVSTDDPVVDRGGGKMGSTRGQASLEADATICVAGSSGRSPCGTTWTILNPRRFNSVSRFGRIMTIARLDVVQQQNSFALPFKAL